MDEIKKVHLMCGKRDFGTGWYNVDGANFPHIHSHDVYLRNLPKNSVDLIYCCHGIAYWDSEQVLSLLAEWKRALRYGGTLRIATPDWDVLKAFDEPMLGPIFGKMPMGNEVVYHKAIYNFYTIDQLLYSVGFRSTQRYDHKQTEHSIFDDHSAAYSEGKLISLNIETLSL